MNMQTMRNLFTQPDSSSQALGQPQQTPPVAPVESSTRALLPPLTAFSLPKPALRFEEKPQIKDLAQKKAGEAYATMMAGVRFQARCSSR